MLQAHPEAVGEAVQRIIRSYEGGSQQGRVGAALALRACAPQLTNQQVPIALDFLLGEGLADADDDVRGQMVTAGAPHFLSNSCASLSSIGQAVMKSVNWSCRHGCSHGAWGK